MLEKKNCTPCCFVADRTGVAMRTTDADCKGPTEEKAEGRRQGKRRPGGQLTLIMGHVENAEMRRVGINRQERSTCY
jgi:hypothetical protein